MDAAIGDRSGRHYFMNTEVVSANPHRAQSRSKTLGTAMGTDDNDHMDERRTVLAEWERALRPKQGRPWLLSLLIWLGVLVAVCLGGQRWMESREAQRLFPSQQNRTDAGTSLSSPTITPAMRSSAPSPITSDGPGARVTPITKCVSRSGGAAYSDGPCPQGAQSIIMAVRPDLNLADGMSPQVREASLRDNRSAALAQTQHEERVARNVDRTASECSEIETRIGWLDALARQPQPASEQDRIRNEKKQARDRQFALRCR
ncbi:hypothetical protein [Variovorax sp. PBL-E5]|uniref:hypothetical protein n=1 Tax=Variovorax sp. PBL-E5 TaxID=434014 RepID=UPI0013173626|nr:hypothetical protein [Variovorax sp. PBL-E5]VTU15923.1 hypothetical protein E5CHR_00004 [Variovorax sp. PBL-E5]